VLRRKKRKKVELDWKDYVAITIAMFETVLLPMVLYIVILFLIALALGFI